MSAVTDQMVDAARDSITRRMRSLHGKITRIAMREALEPLLHDAWASGYAAAEDDLDPEFAAQVTPNPYLGES